MVDKPENGAQFRNEIERKIDNNLEYYAIDVVMVSFVRSMFIFILILMFFLLFITILCPACTFRRTKIRPQQVRNIEWWFCLCIFFSFLFCIFIFILLASEKKHTTNEIMPRHTHTLYSWWENHGSVTISFTPYFISDVRIQH